MTIAFLSHLDLNLYLFRLPIMIELIKRGHIVYAICPRGEKFDLFVQHGVLALDYKIQRKSLNPLKELQTIRNIYRVVKPLELDVLHNFTVKPNIYGSIAGHLARVSKVINSVTGMGSFFIQETTKAKTVRRVIETLYREANKKVSFVIFQNSDDMQYFLDKELVKKNQAVLIKSSGIDSEKFDIQKQNLQIQKALKKELKIDENSIVVLMVARAIWDKGVREYYEAAKELESKYPHVIFLYVGDTDDGNHSCANRDFLSSSNVGWLGHRDDIVDVTALSDIYVLPSYREGVPRTLLEAASMRKPIVTTDAIGCREVVEDGLNGFLVKVKDSKDLACGIEKLINDSSLRESMGINGRIKVLKEFDVKIVVSKYMEVYEKII
ncbi:glycosyltransferase family 4 protein [Sulfurimonas sp. SAG-AH-194-I05]|nr:glycosyltransferase family 4 protein [Sulfurimonas sp. SAG-AH-194-I05]MDF1875190.1 glycosyltransferase family 4 protein [Sulfurimonas sp. SAG-AH-194-I05]